MFAASATAMAEATAAGHSEAVALAVKNCSCMTEAVATSFASDTLFVDLVADATVTAEATVCVEGARPRPNGDTDTGAIHS